MIVVFLGLIFLMYIMIGLASLSKAGEKRQEAGKLADGVSLPKDEGITSGLIEAAPEAAPAPIPEVSPGFDADEEAAVIAAVIAILTSEGVQGTVTAVRRTGANQNAWAYAGRRDLMASRL